MNESFLFIQKFGWGGIIIVLAVVLLLFGGRKIPELMRGLGGGIKEFKNAVKDDEKSGQKAEEKKDE